MDKNHVPDLPDVVLEGYRLVLQHRIVDVVVPLAFEPYKSTAAWVFRCSAPVPVPNAEGLPGVAGLKVIVPDTFPFSPPEIFALREFMGGFPHQDAETGKLCLLEDRLSPRDPSKLVCYLGWAIQWLADAAQGKLLQPGDPYELPDFSRKKISSEGREPVFAFIETEVSLGVWIARLNSTGIVECSESKLLPVIAARRFTAGKELLWECPISEDAFHPKKTYRGRWILLADIRWWRHRPPQTFGELAELCSRVGVDLQHVIREAWQEDNDSRQGVLLVGFPVPRVVGGPDVQVHWQALYFPTQDSDARARRGKQSRGKEIWKDHTQGGGRFAAGRRLPWAKSANVSPQTLFARGGISSPLRSTRIALCGCGALGSYVAEHLVRGGLETLDLFDPDVLEFGNLARHTLDGSAVNFGKAGAMAFRLQQVNPCARISAFGISIPFDMHKMTPERDAIEKAELLIDCTTSDAAFEWLDNYVGATSKRLVMMFIDFRSHLLTICVSGAGTSCGDVYRSLQTEIQAGGTGVDPHEYFHQPAKSELVTDGPGCWHPTFPGAGVHIAMLATTGVDLFTRHLAERQGGLGVVLRRTDPPTPTSFPVPLVEIAWWKEYN